MELPLKDIEERWSLSRLAVGTVLQRYPSRIVAVVQATQGTFVAKMMVREAALGLSDLSDEQIDNQLQIFDYLRLHGFEHAPSLVKTCSGDRFARIDDHIIYLMEYIAGKHPSPSPATFAAFGEVAAQLNALVDYPYPYPISIRGTIEELIELAGQYPFRDAIVEQIAKLAILEDEPVSLIHGELNCANAIQRPDGSLVIVDWDAAGTGPTILEAGYPLITTFVSEDCAVHDAWARAFYTAYTAGAGMSHGNKEVLFIAALLHALRYMHFHNPLQRWQRILYALAHKDRLLDNVPTAGRQSRR